MSTETIAALEQRVAVTRAAYESACETVTDKERALSEAQNYVAGMRRKDQAWSQWRVNKASSELAEARRTKERTGGSFRIAEANLESAVIAEATPIVEESPVVNTIEGSSTDSPNVRCYRVTDQLISSEHIDEFGDEAECLITKRIKDESVPAGLPGTTVLLVNNLLALRGVRSVRVRPFELNITIYPVFKWAEVRFAVVEVIVAQLFAGLPVEVIDLPGPDDMLAEQRVRFANEISHLVARCREALNLRFDGGNRVIVAGDGSGGNDISNVHLAGKWVVLPDPILQYVKELFEKEGWTVETTTWGTKEAFVFSRPEVSTSGPPPVSSVGDASGGPVCPIA